MTPKVCIAPGLVPQWAIFLSLVRRTFFSCNNAGNASFLTIMQEELLDKSDVSLQAVLPLFLSLDKNDVGSHVALFR